MVNQKSKLYKISEQVASCPLGQMVYRFADRCLWTIENSVQWFMKNDELKSPRVRPLPWLLFLPLLLCMRIFKMYCDLFSYLGRRDPPTASEVVCTIQKFRRRLRAIKYAGLKNFAVWEVAQKEKKEEGKGIFIRLFGLSWLATFTGIGRIIIPAKVEQERKLNTIKDVSYSSDTDSPLEELNKQCPEDVPSEEDPDYEPPSENSGDSEDSDASSSSSSTLSLQTADAGSETTSQTFYSSSNITPEPQKSLTESDNIDEEQTAIVFLANDMKNLNLNNAESLNHKDESRPSTGTSEVDDKQIFQDKSILQVQDELAEGTQKPEAHPVNTNEQISQNTDKSAFEATQKQSPSVNNLNESVQAKDASTAEGTQNSIPNSITNVNGCLNSISREKLNSVEDKPAVNCNEPAKDSKQVPEKNKEQKNSIAT